MAIQKINNLLDQHLFLKQYNRLAKMNVPSSYIESCDLYGWYDEACNVKGGYAFARGKHMAWPKLVSTKLQFFAQHELEECLEFNLAWADDDLRLSYFKMLSFWLTSGKIINLYKSIKQVTFAVDAKHEKLVKYYSTIAEQVIYRGPVAKYPDREVIIFSASKGRFKWMPILCAPCYLDRLKKCLARKLLHKSPRRIFAPRKA